MFYFKKILQLDEKCCIIRCIDLNYIGGFMINIICLLFPALFSVFLLERLLSKRFCLHNFLFIFVTNTLAINIISIFFFYSFSGETVMRLSQNTGVRTTHTVAYLAMSTVVAFVGVFIETLYFNRFRVGLKDQPKENNVTTSDDEKSGKE